MEGEICLSIYAEIPSEPGEEFFRLSINFEISVSVIGLRNIEWEQGSPRYDRGSISEGGILES